jgi:hypothetical protein
MSCTEARLTCHWLTVRLTLRSCPGARTLRLPWAVKEQVAIPTKQRVNTPVRTRESVRCSDFGVVMRWAAMAIACRWDTARNMNGL